MRVNRAYFAAGSSDGKIYVAGGEYRFNATSTCEVYDCNTNKWTFVSSLPEEFSGNSGCTDDQGFFYSLGGWKGDEATGDISADSYRYDPKSNTWTQIAPMHYDRAFHCCIHHDGRIYVFGGVDHRKRPIAHGEYYDIASGTWTITKPMPSMHNEGACFISLFFK